jgi:hypothetical protein
MAMLAALLAMRRARSVIALWWLALPALFSLGFWFLAAPRPSLGLGPAWVLGATAAAAVFGRPGARHAVPGVAGLIVLLTIWLAAPTVQQRGSLASPASWRAAVLAEPDAADWFREQAGPDLETYRTESGLILQVPARRNLCRRAPLPCTPHPAPNLALRSPGRLERGFVTQGAWQPSRWPNPSSQFLESWRAGRATSDRERD